MDIASSRGSDWRFATYIEALLSVIAHGSTVSVGESDGLDEPDNLRQPPRRRKIVTIIELSLTTPGLFSSGTKTG
jgi:hypothetical protein